MAFTKTHKRLISIFFAIAALLLLCINGLLLFIITGPRSLNMITPYIESALAPAGSPYHVKIESSELRWDGWRHPVGIHAKNVEVLDAKNSIIADFPEISVGMYFFDLIVGKVQLKSLEVLHPSLLLVQDDTGNISLGFGKGPEPAATPSAADNSLSAAFALLASDAGNPLVTNLQTLIIRHATLSVKKEHGDVFLQSQDASLEFLRRHGTAKGTLALPLQFDKKQGEIDIELILSSRDNTLSAETVYTDIPSSVVHELFPSQGWINAIHMPLSGWAHMQSDFDANISKLDFLLEAGVGEIEYPSLFEKPLKLQRISVTGNLTDKLSTLTVKKGLLDFKTFAIKFDGVTHKQGEDYALDGKAELAGAPIDDIHRYWPLTLSPHTRTWVTSRVNGGVISKATIAVHFKPGELKLKDTPTQAVDATIQIKNATVKYMPRCPAVEEVSGVVKFTGSSMDAKVDHAKYLSDTHVSSGHIWFPDLNAADVRMYLDMDLTAPAKDVVEFLDFPDLNKAKMLNLSSDAKGQVSGNAKLDFIAFSDDDKKSGAVHINYAISADLQNVAQPAFMGTHDISGADMKLTLDNKGLKAVGKAQVNRLPMTLNVSTRFAKGGETTYSVKTEMPSARLPDFGLPKLDFVKGAMGVNATFISSDDMEKADASIDLTRALIDLPEHGFTKKIGSVADLRLATERLPNGNTLISSFTIKGQDFSATGKAEFEKASGDFSWLTLDALRMGNQDLSYLNYVKAPGSIKLVAKGRSFDLAPYLLKSNSTIPARGYDIDIETDRLLLGDNRVMNSAIIKADCPAQCRTVTIHTKLSDGTPFDYNIGNGKLAATCNNAGELLRVLGVFEGVKGGKMSMTGDYKGSKLEGKTVVKDYTLAHAPVLTKIFTIASLTGILDTLSGNGIAFSKLTAPFVYEQDIIILKDAKAYGSALGITADGSIDMRRALIDLKGTLVPSYTMNSLVGNIPLLGDILIGGKGKGIIALNYGVHGDMKDPIVNVNPLSVFTPGFLRNVFNIFDEPAPDLEKIEADRKKDEDKAKLNNVTTPAAPATTTPAQSAPAPKMP